MVVQYHPIRGNGPWNFNNIARCVPCRPFVGEAEEGVAAVATGVASCAAADLSLGDLAADIVLRSVGVERDLGPLQHQEQFAFVGMEPSEQAIEGDEAGLAREDAIEPCRQGGLALLGGMLAIGFESAIEPPDQRTGLTLREPLPIGEGVELVNEALARVPA